MTVDGVQPLFRAGQNVGQQWHLEPAERHQTKLLQQQPQFSTVANAGLTDLNFFRLQPVSPAKYAGLYQPYLIFD